MLRTGLRGLLAVAQASKFGCQLAKAAQLGMLASQEVPKALGISHLANLGSFTLL